MCQKHKQKFAGHKDWNFISTDILVDLNILTDSHDIILCRMLLQHLVTVDVVTMLRQFSESDTSYLLATVFLNIMHIKKFKPPLPLDSEIHIKKFLGATHLLIQDGPYANVDCPTCNHYLGFWEILSKRFADSTKPNVGNYITGFKNPVYSCQ